jgi:hypothetical protein
MNKKVLLLIAGIAVAVGLLMVFSQIDNRQTADMSDLGTRNPADYVGVDACKGCHPGVYAEWQTTFHGIDFANNWTYGGNPTNKFTYAGGGCVSCHVVGYNETSIGGYDPAQAWNSTYNSKLLGIQCEVCHGPGSDHIAGPDSGNINLDRDPYAGACEGTDEAGCHGGAHQYGNDTVMGWNASAHAPWDNIAQTDPGGLNTYCARCKSPSQWDPDASYGNNVEIPKEEWRGITCGDCHDVHTETDYSHQLRYSREDACSTCHTSDGATSPSSPHHPQSEFREGITGSEMGAPFMGTVECQSCHMYNTPRGVYPQLTGHSFEPTPQACWNCHQTGGIPPELVDNATAWAEVDAWQAEVTALLTAAESSLTAAETAFEDAEVAGSASEHTLTMAQNLLDNASFNVHFVEEDKSHGVHNYYYAIELLEAAEKYSDMVVEVLDAPNAVTGLTATAEDDRVTLTWTTSTAADFAYYNIYASTDDISNVSGMAPVGTVFDKSTTTYEVAGLDGLHYFAVTAVDLDGNEIPTGVTSASASPAAIAAGEEMPMWAWLVIALLVVVAIVALLAAVMGRRGGEALAEEEFEPEAPEPPEE